MGHGAELIQLISTSNNKPYIICIQETWFGNGSNKKKWKPIFFKIPGCTSYLRNRENSIRGGIATLIKISIPHIHIKYQATNNNLEVLGLTIQHNTMPIDIINVYSPPGAAHNTLTLDNYDNLIKPNHNLILVHFNCYNTLWRSPKTDPQGNIVENFLNNNNLVCLNDGSITNIADNNTGTSAINLSFSSANIRVND